MEISDLDQLAIFRKETPKVLHDNHLQRFEEHLKCLKQIKINLQDDGKCVQIYDEMFGSCIKIRENVDATLALLPRVYEQTQLLQILTKMNDSAICRIINDI